MKIIIVLLVCIPLVFFLFDRISKDESFQFLGQLTSKVNTPKKRIALTFDDGPTVGKTEQILEILEKQRVKATFYLVGKAIEENPEQAKMIINQGHELGNHSYSHQRMMYKTYDFVATEIERTTALLREVGYTSELTFRPPYGRKLFVLPYYLQEKGIHTVTWNVEPDSILPLDSSPEDLAEYAVDHTKPGSIILMHVMFDSRANSMASIPLMIMGLREQGYEFVTVSELISEQAMASTL